jgi:Clr5 domain
MKPDWGSHRDNIQTMYFFQDLPLKEVIARMKRDHNFEARYFSLTTSYRITHRMADEEIVKRSTNASSKNGAFPSIPTTQSGLTFTTNLRSANREELKVVYPYMASQYQFRQ